MVGTVRCAALGQSRGSNGLAALAPCRCANQTLPSACLADSLPLQALCAWEVTAFSTRASTACWRPEQRQRRAPSLARQSWLRCWAACGWPTSPPDPRMRWHARCMAPAHPSLPPCTCAWGTAACWTCCGWTQHPPPSLPRALRVSRLAGVQGCLAGRLQWERLSPYAVADALLEAHACRVCTRHLRNSAQGFAAAACTRFALHR